MNVILLVGLNVILLVGLCLYDALNWRSLVVTYIYLSSIYGILN